MKEGIDEGWLVSSHVAANDGGEVAGFACEIRMQEGVFRDAQSTAVSSPFVEEAPSPARHCSGRAPPGKRWRGGVEVVPPPPPRMHTACRPRNQYVGCAVPFPMHNCKGGVSSSRVSAGHLHWRFGECY